MATNITTMIDAAVTYFRTTSPSPNLTTSSYFGNGNNIIGYVPNVAGVEMPLLAIHVASTNGVSVRDERIALTGASGIRKESFHVNLDIFNRLTKQTQMSSTQFGQIQKDIHDIADGVRQKMLADVTWGGSVQDGDYLITGDWWVDPLRARMQAHTFLAWRWEVDIIVNFPLN